MKRNASMVYCKMVKRSLVGILVTALVVSLLSGVGMVFSDRAQAADDSQVLLHNPVYDSGVREVEPGREDAVGNIHNPVYNAETDETTWDCVWFGNYWQNDTNGDGVADKNDEKEPIKWRVLSVDGDDVFLLADKNLDRKPYNEKDRSVTWENCTLRSWLNGYSRSQNVCGTDYTSNNFLDVAFSEEEQSAIKKTYVVNDDDNDDDSEDATEGGNDTMDKVYLLSIAEVSNTKYGFCGTFNAYSDTRISGETGYVRGDPMQTGTQGFWWLRSPGSHFLGINCVASIYYSGKGSGWGDSVDYEGNDIRPALHLSLSALSLFASYGGTVHSKWGGKATWDCVYFGNYWQNDNNGDGRADKNDAKEPIKWRVLSIDGDDMFLLADSNLDAKPYNTEYTDITWERCTIRSWLNGYNRSKNDKGIDYTSDNFINAAFSGAEQAVIKDTNIVNGDNPYYGTEGRMDTVDKIYLLSIAETLDSVYGFHNVYCMSSDTRMSLNTTYVADYSDDNGVSPDGFWWLRSPGSSSNMAACVGSSGYVYSSATGEVDYGLYAVRPVLHLDISNTNLWSYAGTICSDGTVTDVDGNVVPTPVPTKVPEKSPSPTPGNMATTTPIASPTADVTERPVSPTKSPVINMTTPTPASGQVVKDTSSKAFYQIISVGVSEGTVSYLRPENKTKKAKVPAVIYHDGKKYKVTSIAEKAFAGNKKLKTVIIGKNVKVIQKKAFAKCKSLSKVMVKSKVLDKVAKNAFKGTNKKLIVKVPKKKKINYQKLFKGKGNKKLQVK